jgi:hypothetical protein
VKQPRAAGRSPKLGPGLLSAWFRARYLQCQAEYLLELARQVGTPPSWRFSAKKDS